MATKPPVDWAWIGDHLDDIAARTIQHLGIAAIAIAVGFAISFTLSLWAVRDRRVFAPITGLAGVLYTIPSLALFAALVPITGLSLLTAEIPLVLYTLLILVRNIVAGFDAVPNDVLEAASGMGFSRAGRLWRVELPLAIPLIVAGLRLASVRRSWSRRGDPRRSSAAGACSSPGPQTFFPTKVYVGAVPSVALALGRFPVHRAAAADPGELRRGTAAGCTPRARPPRAAAGAARPPGGHRRRGVTDGPPAPFAWLATRSLAGPRRDPDPPEGNSRSGCGPLFRGRGSLVDRGAFMATPGGALVAVNVANIGRAIPYMPSS